jgi:hypothetical protein
VKIHEELVINHLLFNRNQPQNSSKKWKKAPQKVERRRRRKKNLKFGNGEEDNLVIVHKFDSKCLQVGRREEKRWHKMDIPGA